MSIYASKTPRDLNHDPMPWHVSLTPSRGGNGRWREWRGAASSWDDALVRAEDAHPGWTAHTGGLIPRPEFDHKQHNEPNPILVEFRDVAGTHFPFAEDLDWWLKCLEDPTFDYTASGYRWTRAHVDHARRVLERLARFRRQP